MPDYSMEGNPSPQPPANSEPHLRHNSMHDSHIKSEPRAESQPCPAAENCPAAHQHLHPIKGTPQLWEQPDAHRAAGPNQDSAYQVKLEPKQEGRSWHTSETIKAEGTEDATEIADQWKQQVQQQPWTQQQQVQWQWQQQRQQNMNLAAEAETEMDKLKIEHLRARFQSALQRRQQVRRIVEAVSSFIEMFSVPSHQLWVSTQPHRR